jgi:hypothetical protein
LIAQVKRRPSGRPGDNVWPAQIGTCPQDLPCEINDAATAKGLSFTMVLVDLKNPWVMPARGLPRSLLPGAAALAASRRRRAHCFPAPPRYHKVFIARELVVRTAKRPARATQPRGPCWPRGPRRRLR